MKKILFFLLVSISAHNINAQQNVGIGTATPIDKLSVVTNVQGYGITHAFGTVKVGTYLTATNAQFGTRSNHPLQFFTNNGAAQVTLLQNGNVGIGTETPNGLLVVAGTVATIGSNGGFEFDDMTGGAKGFKWYATGGSGYLHEYQAFKNVISISPQGNIGFSIDDPQSALHVNPGGAGSILIGTNKNSGGYTNLEMGISAQSGGYSYLQSTQASGTAYGNLYLNPNGGNVYLNPNGGNVGINTTIATFPLDIVQTGEGNANGSKAVRIRTTWAGSNYNWSVYGFASLWFSLNGVDKGFISYMDGSWNATSDMRYKKDIDKMDNVLDKVMSLKPKTYHYNDQKENDRLCTGFVAQEVLPFFPELVNSAPSKDDHSTLYGLNYAGFSVVAIKAIQEQQQQIEALTKVVEELKAMVIKNNQTASAR